VRPHVAPCLRMLAALCVAGIAAGCGAWPPTPGRSGTAPARVALAAASGTAHAAPGSDTGAPGALPVAADPPPGIPAAAAPAAGGMTPARLVPDPLAGLDVHGAAFLPGGIGFLAAWSGAGCYGAPGLCTGRILRFTDGGHTLGAVYTAGGFLGDISFPDPAHGWALGGTCSPEEPAAGCASTLLATADGGASWKPVYSRTDALFAKVDFVDARHGWLSLRTGGLLRSTDGGRAWVPATPPCAGVPDLTALGSFSFLNADVGFAVCEAPAAGATVAKEVLRTADGGRHWTRLNAAVPSSGGVVDLAFSSPTTGWLCTWPVGGPLFRSRDGGRIWTPAAGSLGGANVVALSASPADPGRVYAVIGLGPSAAVVRSSDAGQTWNGVYPRVGPFLGAGGGPAVLFTGPEVGYGIGVPSDPTAFFRTGDGGGSWTPVGRLPAGDALIDWSFGAGGAGWAIVVPPGRPPELVSTPNAGRSWTVVAGAPAAPPRLAVRTSAADGVLVAGDTLFRTVDAGKRFTSVGSAAGIAALALPPAGAGWAIVRGRLRRSGDGGRTWADTAVLPAADEALDVSFADGSHGWVLTDDACNREGACAQALWSTSDGGRTWTSLALGGLDVAAIDFTTAADGWLTTSSGALYRTEDGGRTWQALD